MHPCMYIRRHQSNRRNVTETKSGGKTSSRTSQALTTVTARGLTEHVTVKRLIEKSARRRIARFSRQGRHAKLVEKRIVAEVAVATAGGVEVEEEELEVEPGASSIEATTTTTGRPANRGKSPKQVSGKTKSAKKKSKNALRQEKIKKLIALSAKRPSKK